MLNACVDITELQLADVSDAASLAVLPLEARNAIRKAFPYDGYCRAAYLWCRQGITRYRVNWFRQVNGETRIVKSCFLCITRTGDGLVVEDATVL